MDKLIFDQSQLDAMITESNKLNKNIHPAADDIDTILQCLQDSGELTIAIEAQIMFLIIFQPHSLEIDGVIITPEPVLEYHATRSAADWELSRLQRMRSVKTVKLYEEL